MRRLFSAALLSCLLQFVSSFSEIRTIPCDDVVNLKYEDIQFLDIQEPVLLKQCNATDPEFIELMSVLGTKKQLKQRYGKLELNVFPTGPFHLQLGSTLLPLKPIGSTTLAKAVDRLGENAFAFGTTGDNPGYTIVSDTLQIVKSRERRYPVPHNVSRKFREYFKDFDAHIFSMGGKHSGAPFHFHQSAWLYLCSGHKEWIIAPFEYHMDPEIQWTSLAALKRQSPLEDLFPQQEVLHAIQGPGDLVLLPSFWVHATLNLDDFTTGVGGQQHPGLNGNDPPAMKEYITAFTNENWERAAEVQKQSMDSRPANVGAVVRYFLMSLRNGNADDATHAFRTARDLVHEAYTKGLIVENDVDFLLTDQFGACLSDSMTRVAKKDAEANGGSPPETISDEFLSLLKLQREMQMRHLPVAPPKDWSDRIQGGVGTILGPLCFDEPNFVTPTGHNCSHYARQPSLCRKKAECSPGAPGGVQHCESLTRRTHKMACCVCGGGRDFRDANKKAAGGRMFQVAGDGSVAGGDSHAVYMQIKNRKRGTNKRRT